MKTKPKKGILLVIATVVMAVVSVLTGVYLSSLVTEKRSFDTSRGVVQAVNLAEAAAHMAFAEIKKRIPGDLNGRVSSATAATLAAYVDGNNALGFLRDYAYASGATQLSVAGGNATLTFSLPSISMGIEGSGTATITIASRSAPTKDSSDGPFRFFYTFSIEATGSITRYNPALHKTVAYSPNNFNLIVLHGNFAKFALFTSHHRTPGNTTVWFTENTNFSGPVHTNDRFSFANNPSAHFTSEVTQHENKASYYNNGHSVLLDDDHNAALDVPTFDDGFSRGQDIINLPSSVSQTQLRDQALGTMSVPGSSNPGVFVPNQGGACTGGIYINGSSGDHDDDATIALGMDAGNNPQYTISQTITSHHSSTTHTYVITVNLSANTTSLVVDAGSPATYNGKPDGVGNEGILIYANDDIAGFSGTVQRNTSMTVSSERDVVITGNVLYQDYTASPLSAEGFDNMLGILSWGGNVRIGSAAPNNVQIHGVVMAHSGIFTVDNYDGGHSRGTATLLGGVITDFYGPFGTFSGGSMVTGYGRNFVYDPRVLEGKTPPYFPYMSDFTANIAPADTFDTRTSWREKEG